MKIIYKNVEDLKEYENNPRINKSAVEYVIKSIKEFGFRVPIIIDKDNTIVCGHTRYKACKELDIYKIPCILADDLTSEQIKAFRLIDNKSSELAIWDINKLELELKSFKKLDNINVKEFDLISKEDNFFSQDKQQEKFENQEDNEEYNDFVNKFKEKHTSDDCYTPKNIYDAAVDFVENEYKVNKKDFVRPFYPNGDYKKYKYKDSDIVVDNPPFSIYSEIVNFYTKNNIKFFLFAPGLTFLTCKNKDVTYIVSSEHEIVYQNGARVNTNFVTNLEKSDVLIRTANNFGKTLKILNSKNTRKLKQVRRYEVPKNVLAVNDINIATRKKEDLFIKKSDCEFIDYLFEEDGTKVNQFGTKLIVNNKVLTNINNLEKILEEEEEEEEVIKLIFNDKQKKILEDLNKRM